VNVFDPMQYVISEVTQYDRSIVALKALVYVIENPESRLSDKAKEFVEEMIEKTGLGLTHCRVTEPQVKWLFMVLFKNKSRWPEDVRDRLKELGWVNDLETEYIWGLHQNRQR